MTQVKNRDRQPSASEVKIEVMRKRHLDQVLQIEGRAYNNPWSRAVFEAELVQGISRTYLVALDGKEVVGYCGTLYITDEAHITNIAVDPSFQRNHIGTRLLSHVVRLAWERHIKGITLEVRVSNFGAQRLYQKFGFQPAGVRKGYYQDSGEDAIIMWAYDIDSPEYKERILMIETSVGIKYPEQRRRKLFWR